MAAAERPILQQSALAHSFAEPGAEPELALRLLLHFQPGRPGTAQTAEPLLSALR